MAESFVPELPLLLALDAALELPSFFSKLEAETRGTFLPTLQFRRFAKDEVIVSEGEPGGEFFVLLQGTLAVKKKRVGGPDQQVAALSPGDTFGEVAVMAGSRRSASIVADEPAILVSLSTRDLEKVIEREPEFGERLEAQARSRLSESPE